MWDGDTVHTSPTAHRALDSAAHSWFHEPYLSIREYLKRGLDHIDQHTFAERNQGTEPGQADSVRQRTARERSNTQPQHRGMHSHRAILQFGTRTSGAVVILQRWRQRAD